MNDKLFDYLKYIAFGLLAVLLWLMAFALASCKTVRPAQSVQVRVDTTHWAKRPAKTGAGTVIRIVYFMTRKD